MTSLALARAAAGLPVAPDGLPPRVARAVAVATDLGSPLVAVLREAEEVEEERRALVRAVEVASAEGRAVARALVLAPPVLGPATALLVADAPFAVWSTPTGQVVRGVAAALWGVGAAAVRALVRGAIPVRGAAEVALDELLDLAAVAVAAGVAVPEGLRVAAATLGAHGQVGHLVLWLELGAAGPPPVGWDDVGPLLAAARRDGLAAAPLLRAVAARLRREAHHVAMQRAARLGARLSVPTTLLLLPAAGLVVAAPLVHGLVTSLG